MKSLFSKLLMVLMTVLFIAPMTITATEGIDSSPPAEIIAVQDATVVEINFMEIEEATLNAPVKMFKMAVMNLNDVRFEDCMALKYDERCFAVTDEEITGLRLEVDEEAAAFARYRTSETTTTLSGTNIESYDASDTNKRLWATATTTNSGNEDSYMIESGNVTDKLFAEKRLEESGLLDVTKIPKANATTTSTFARTEDNGNITRTIGQAKMNNGLMIQATIQEKVSGEQMRLLCEEIRRQQPTNLDVNQEMIQSVMIHNVGFVFDATQEAVAMINEITLNSAVVNQDALNHNESIEASDRAMETNRVLTYGMDRTLLANDEGTTILETHLVDIGTNGAVLRVNNLKSGVS